MIDETDVEVVSNAVVGAASATGVPTTIKGKIQRAILRLVIGSVDPSRIEMVRANVSTVEGRSRIDAMVAEELGRQAIADPLFMERAKARFLGDLTQKQENLEAIAAKAQEQIDAAPDADEQPIDPTAEPSQDWMNTFTREAESASSEELRDRLAAVLAGEARRPGTYSRATVRLIAELEQEVLVEFQAVLVNRVGDDIVSESSWNEGNDYVRGILLEDAALISGTGGFTQRNMNFDSNGNGFFVGSRLGLVAVGQADLTKQVGIWLLTRVGKEVASLLPQGDEGPPLQKLAEALDKSGLKKIFIGRIAHLDGGSVRILQDEVAWEAPEESTP